LPDDALVSYRQSMVAIDDPEVVCTSGKTHHPIVAFAGQGEDRVAGAVFEISDAELAHADAYEVAAYVRVPRWIGHTYDLDHAEQKTAFIRKLQAESRQNRVSMMAPEPPSDFVERPKQFDALKKQLLDAKGDSVAGITAALRGAGGYGKTTLAKVLAHDPDIQDAYFDGNFVGGARRKAQCPSNSPGSDRGADRRTP
jgi:hypothetical protein